MKGTDLQSGLAQALAQLRPGPLLLGYSGGLDSSVLLHALSSVPEARRRGIEALHVEHGLHPDSPRWAEHCARVCARLDVPLRHVAVAIAAADISQSGLEGAARNARHAAFTAALPDDGVLVLAQHRNDQAETLLLRLLHGAGHEGLGGMQKLREFGPGWLWRPLLDTAREQLQAHAQQHHLDWIEDPSNVDTQHARNHLRLHVLPALRARWPDADRRIAAAAARLRDEADVLQQVAMRELAQAQGTDPQVLDVRAVRALPAALRRCVIGLWLDALQLPRPPPGVWSRLQPDLLDARVDATPHLAWRGAELRRYRESLHAMVPLPAIDDDWTLPWDGQAPLELPRGFGWLRLDPPPAQVITLQVRARRGGERLDQAGVRRALRTLLQDLGVPPWLRARLPLLCNPNGELLAVADLAFAPDFEKMLAAAGTRLRWQPPD